MILNVSHVKKAFIEDVVIKDATFHLEDREKTALVGNNGAGKSTLFKIIAGLESMDGGEVSLQKGKTMGYLAQHADLLSDTTVFNEVMSIRQHVFDLETEMRALEAEMAGAEGAALDLLVRRHSALQDRFHDENGYAIRSEVEGVLKGLGFTEEEFALPVSVLSGGEKTRVALAKLLLTKPDLLLLDEPTNHLDIHALSWLENYLLSYPGAVFVISHDRYFLEKTVTKIVDLSMGETRTYQGSYSLYVEKKKAVWEDKLRRYEQQQRYIRHQEEVISTLRSYKQEKFYKRAESRENALSRMELVDRPTEENASMKLRLIPNMESGKDVLKIEHLSKSFDGKLLFSEANIDIKKGERIAIIGDNGTGKSTLLRMITGELAPDHGTVTYGANVCIGYYDQEQALLSPEKTIFDEIGDTYPTMTNTEIRNTLAAFLFTEDDVFKLVGDLSGGEKGRVSLAKLMLSDSNTLILDEPTNNLDMISKEILENALLSYEGTILTVSHDRYFINKTATRIIELFANTFLSYIGNYDYYLEKRDLFHQKVLAENAAGKPKDTSASEKDWRRQKEESAKKRKTENDLRKAEEEIAALEEKIREKEEALLDPAIATDAAALGALTLEKEALTAALDAAYEKWAEMV